MWPKAVAQLIELAPHLARLLPMADRFFQAKSADAEASATAMQQMAEGLRGDLGQVTASHAGLYRQLNDQSEKLSTIATDLHATRLSVDSTQARITRLEHLMARLALGLGLALILLSLILIISAMILFHHH